MIPKNFLSSAIAVFILTILIGLAGTAIAITIDFPAPYLSGPVVAVAGSCFLGFTPYVPHYFTQLSFVFVGIMMGTGITPDMIAAIKIWPVSFGAVMIAICILLYSAYWVLKLIFGYDHNTAMLASSPGHLTYVLSLAVSIKADLSAVSVVQSIRLVALTISVPIIVEYFNLIDVEKIVKVVPMTLIPLIATIIGSIMFALALQWWKLPAALLIGGVVVSGTTHLTGIIEGGVPDWVAIPTYIYLGCMIGARFSEFSGADFRRACIAGLVVTVVVVMMASAFALGVSQITGVPLSAVMIAFAPGGLETMSAMAIMMHADTAYVGAHHLLRLFFLTVLMPIVLNFGEKSQN